MISVMRLSLAEYLIWLGVLSLGLGNAVLLVRRKLDRQLPWLLAYLLVSSGYGTVLWLLQPHLSAKNYTLAYWIHQLTLLVITLFLVYSFWRIGLAPYRGLYRLCAAVLLITVATGLLVVLFTSHSGPSIALTPANWLNQWLYLFYRSAMFVAAVLLWAFVGFVRAFRIQVSATIRYLVLGLFLFALAHIVLDSWTYLRGAPSGRMLTYLHFFSAFLLHGVWCVTIFRYRAGEPVETRPMVNYNASQEELERRMDAINLALLQITGSGRPR
jgi:hypothetical protein